MEIILLERVSSLGNLGDVVRVRDGYARNFLLPRGKALRATPGNLTRVEEGREQLEEENARRREQVAASADAFEELQVVIIRQSSERGQLYGSVTARDIADAVTKKAGKVDRRQILLDRAIKALGIHLVRISLHPEIEVEVTVNVARTEEEAKAQEERGEAVIGLLDEDEDDEDDAPPQVEDLLDSPPPSLEDEAPGEDPAAEASPGDGGPPESVEGEASEEENATPDGDKG